MKKVRGVLIWLASLLLVLGLSITANAADELTGTANMSAFKDIAANDQALPFVNYLVGKEIIKGYPDGTFHPKSGLTRTEAAVVICKAAGITIDKSSVSSFKDVNRIYWAKDYINKAAQAGYIKGNPDKTFRPEQELTRAEGISLIFRLSQSDISQAALPSLTDINNGHWAAKPIAAALAAGMVGLSPDGKKFMPDAPFTRINLAQALGSLLTEDPSLYQTSLPGCLKPITGQITIKRTGSQQEESVDKETNVSVGDTITSVKGAKAEIDYPDGSSLLIKDATQITVKAAEGRKYIKTNGSEGIAVDWLNLDISKGTMFAGLATRHEGNENNALNENGKISNIIASLAGIKNYGILGSIAANTSKTKQQAWYTATQTKKVKVQVDMPWGVAAVRGTFVVINVDSSGQSNVSCLTGNAEVTGNGQTVPLLQNQATQLSSLQAPPPPPVPIPPAQVQQIAQEQQWVQQTAQIMDQQQEAPPALVPTLPAASEPLTPTMQAINQALGTLGVGPLSAPSQPTHTESSDGPTASSACELVTVTSPSSAVISGSSVAATIANEITSVTVDLGVSPNATWKLYSDSGCVSEITGKIMSNLAVGANTAYIKVVAQDGITYQTYSLVITRIGSNVCDLIAVTSPASAVISGNNVTAAVGNDVTSVTIDLEVSPNAAWKLYSDSSCNTEILDKQLALAIGNNQAYIKVIAQDGITESNYILGIRRLSNDANVATTGNCYTVNNTDNTITADQTVINTNVPISTFLTNLSKHSQAVWKVVTAATVISNLSDYDNAASITTSDTLIFGDKLAVKAEDGSIKAYTITVVLGDPVAGGGAYPGTPGGLKGPVSGWTWGLYRYWVYDLDSNPWPPYVYVIAFNQSNQEVQRWQINGGRYITGISLDSGARTFNITTEQGNPNPTLTVPWDNVKIAQP